MASLFDVYPNDLIEKIAEKLKSVEEIKAPDWATFAKTGSHKERPPVELDWWYTRSAALLRSVAILGPIGVSKLRNKYGGKKRRGVKPSRFRRAGGCAIRKVLQQLDKAGLTIVDVKSQNKGRIISPKGQSLLDKTALEILKSQPKREVKVETPKKEKPKGAKKEASKAEAKEKEALKSKEAPTEKKVEAKPEVKESPKAEAKKEKPKEEKVPEVKTEEAKKE